MIASSLREVRSVGVRFLTLVAAVWLATPLVLGDEAKHGNEVQLSGLCTDNTGQAIAGATAVLYYCADSMNNVEVVETVTTNEAGSFRFQPIDIEAGRYGSTRYLVAVTAKKHASFLKRILRRHLSEKIEATLHNQPATLVGYVTGPDGKPVANAHAFMPVGFDGEPIAGVKTATTDAKGIFRITDMSPWRPEKPGQKGYFLYLDHADFARTSVLVESAPQILRVKLDPPAVVAGRVLDAVTNQPAADTVVSAQGVDARGWFQTRTDADGYYELRMTADRYNIWAEKKDRIAVAVESIKATAGKSVAGADIKLVRGAIVYGNVIGVGEGEQSAKDLWVAHYGTARPRSGAAVTSTKVNDDGTYRLRVAPGNNYLYLMGGGGSINVDVADGEELHAHIVPGIRANIAGDPGK